MPKKTEYTYHPNAARNFDERAIALSRAISIRNPPVYRNHDLDIPVDTILTKEDIVSYGPVITEDGHGSEIGRYRIVQDKAIGIDGNDHKNFINLCASLHKDFQDVVSFEYVVDHAFIWIFDYLCQRMQITRYLIGFLKNWRKMLARTKY